jgi:lipoprotein-releasing system permease protein
MGAKRSSIVAIFALCGMVTGVLSCLIGGALALFTLQHLETLVSLLSALQGRAALNPIFFGPQLTGELSPEATLFVVIATPLLSILAALIPALKASRIRPSTALRSE